MRAFYDRFIAFVIALGLLVAGAVFAYAGPYEDALAGFTTDDFSDTADAVNAVAASGSPLAGPLIEALQDGRLSFSAKDKKVYIKTNDGALLDAATGKPAEGAPPDDIDAVRLNNRLRGVVDAAVGGLTLMASDTNRRYDAALEKVTKRRLSIENGLEQALRTGQFRMAYHPIVTAKNAHVLGFEEFMARARQWPGRSRWTGRQARPVSRWATRPCGARRPARTR